MEAFEQTSEALKLARKAHRIFAGRQPVIVGGALCECVATYLAGHVVPGDARATANLRAGILAAFVETIKKLVPVIDEEVIRPRVSRMRQ